MTKGAEYAWDSTFSNEEDRVQELDKRLQTYESLVHQVDERLATEVATFRRSLSGKTSPDDVRAIIAPSLDAIRQRMGKIEGRVDNLESRMTQLESIFGGMVPYLPPSPLLLSTAKSVDPKAHPLTVEWLKLLVRSEKSRVQLHDLSQKYPDTSTKIQDALKSDKVIIDDTLKFYDRVKRELATKLAEREGQLKEYLPRSPEMVAIDDQLSALFWLFAVAKPMGSKEHKGRLGVPMGVFGREASEILIALDIAGIEQSTVEDFYLLQLQTSPAPSVDYTEIDSATFDNTLSAAAIRAKESLGRFTAHWADCRATSGDLAEKLKLFSPRHPDVVAFLKTQKEQQGSIMKISEELSIVLIDATRAYVKSLVVERADTVQMRLFKRLVLDQLAGAIAMVPKSATPSENEWAVFVDADLKGSKWDLNGQTDKDVRHLYFSPDSNKMVILGSESSVWSVQNRRLLATLRLNGNKTALDGNKTAMGSFNPKTGQEFLTWADRQDVRVWDMNTYSVKLTMPTQAATAWFTPDGETVVTKSGGEHRLWNAKNGDEIRLPQVSQAGLVHFEADFEAGEVFVTRDDKGCAFLGSRGDVISRLVFPQQKERVTFAVSKNKRRCAYWNEKSSDLEVWDFQSKEVVYRETEHDFRSSSDRQDLILISPDGEWVATEFGYGVEIHSVTGNRKSLVEEVKGILSGYSFSPTGRFLSAYTDNRTQGFSTKIFDVKTGRVVASPLGRASAFSPDEKWIATDHGLQKLP